MSIGDDQVYPGQAAGAQRGQELAPELIGLAVTDGGAQDLTGAVDGQPGGHHQRLRDHITPETTLQKGPIPKNEREPGVGQTPGRKRPDPLSQPAPNPQNSRLGYPAL